MLLAALAFSFTANTAFSLLHEAVHGLFSPRRSLNEWAGRLASAWFPTGLSVQRAFHLTHHRYNRSDLEQFDTLHDGDIVWLKRAQWYSIYTGLYWLITVVGVAVFALVPGAHRLRSLRDRSGQVATQTGSSAYFAALEGVHPEGARLEILASLAFQAALFLALDLSMAGWAACYAAFAVQWSWLQYTDHAFSPLNAADGAWNLRVGPIGRLFFLDYHLHLAHHQHPAAPWRQLRSLMDPEKPRPSYYRVLWHALQGPRRPEDFPRFDTETEARGLLILITGCMLIFVTGYGAASLWGPLVPWRLDLAFAWESAIPFVPAAAFAYLALLPLLGLAPLVLKRWQACLPLAACLVVETFAGVIAFLLLPARPAFPERIADGIPGLAFTLADTLNLDGNEFPSLHVAFAVTVALALHGAVGRARIPLWIGVALIAASTLFLHEHHVLDVVAGAALALLAWVTAGRWASRLAVVAAVEIECLCLSDFHRFGRRHPRYWLLAFLLLLDSLRGWRSRRVLRTGFAFLQRVDDLLDGHRPSPREPLEVVAELSDAIRRSRYGVGESMRLAEAFVGELRVRAGKEGEESVSHVLRLLAAMGRDRRRVLDRALWPAEDLRTHQRETFSLSLDLLLAARGSRLRSSRLESLVELLGWCSVMRDLREDWEGGLCNVPREVMGRAREEGFEGSSLDGLLETVAMREWMGEEYTRAGRLLAEVDRSWADGQDRDGEAIARMFWKSIRDFHHRRYPRLYPARRGPNPALTSRSEAVPATVST